MAAPSAGGPGGGAGPGQRGSSRWWWRRSTGQRRVKTLMAEQEGPGVVDRGLRFVYGSSMDLMTVDWGMQIDLALTEPTFFDDEAGNGAVLTLAFLQRTRLN